MVRYHEAGRFCEKDEQWDQDSAMFHLERAALCGELEAIVALGQCLLQLPHHILPDMELEVDKTHFVLHFLFSWVWFCTDVFSQFCGCCRIMQETVWKVLSSCCRRRRLETDLPWSWWPELLIPGSICQLTGQWSWEKLRSCLDITAL